MLTTDIINYPITFFNLSTMTAKSITFTSPTDGLYSNGSNSGLGIAHFINMHNKRNSSNFKDKQYYFEMANKDNTTPRNPFRITGDNRDLINNMYDNSIANTAFIMRYLNAEQTGKIEDMPLGVKLKAIEVKEGEWFECIMTPKTVEIHDDVVVLLLHYFGGVKRAVSGEISIKRGTRVKWQK